MPNYIYNDRAGNNKNFQKTDVIQSLDSIDKIFIQGATDNQLSVGTVSYSNNGGQKIHVIGIYAGGSLEAVYTGGDLSVQQVIDMTSGLSV